MALQISLLAADTLVGEAFPESYCKVEFVRAFKSESLLWVNWYANGTARADMKHPVKQREYTAETAHLVGSNIIAASYEWLKTLPEFAGAVDVLVTPEPSFVPEPPVIEMPTFMMPPVVVEPVAVEETVVEPTDGLLN
jgi:hypothetical protein